MVMRHSVRAALDPVDPFANKMGLVDRLSPQAAKGSAVEIGEFGFPIGLFSDASYEEQIIEAEPGSRLYLYSDGLTEMVNLQDETFGRARLREAIDNSRGRPLQETLSYLLEHVHAWSGGTRREDDVSLLAVEIQ